MFYVILSHQLRFAELRVVENNPKPTESMFHCTVSGDYIVLLDWEARSLATTVIGLTGTVYNMRDIDGGNHTARRNYKAMISHLREQRRRDPDAFRAKYISRDARHPDCLPYFFALADGYRRSRVLIDLPEIAEFERFAVIPGDLADYRAPDCGHLHFLARLPLMPWKAKVIASQEVRVSEMLHVFGTTDMFTLVTPQQEYHFTPDGVDVVYSTTSRTTYNSTSSR